MELGPYIWLIIAVVSALAEMLTLGLFTLWFLVGALAAFIASFFGANLFIQALIFLAVSLLCLLLIRPVALKARARGQNEEPSLIGQNVVVCETIDNDAMTGRVQTANKLTWKARSIDASVIEKGARAQVVAQESITLIVERKN